MGKQPESERMRQGQMVVVGALVGAATGVAAALLLHRRVGRDDRTTAITPGEGLKLGLLLFGLLRAIASLGDEG
jgi:nitrate reductase gamma subunit